MDVRSEYEYFSDDGKFAFHSTAAENVESIQRSGIQRNHGDQSDSSEIIEALEALGHDDPFPFNRREVVYLHIDPEYVANDLNRRAELPIESNSVFIVVAIDQIDAPMYLADMSIITDLIDYQHGGADQMMHAETPEEVVDLYRDSITRIESPADFESYEGLSDASPELVVDGDIPPEAVVDVLQ